jgi:hypothetical protein
MLKLSRIRPCEYNRSCSSFHSKSNKIGFVFFWIFYDFLRILQISAKRIYYWRCIFATRPLERFRTAQLGPSTHETAGSPEIWRLRRRSRSGNDSGSSACSPRTDWQPRFGRGSTLRRHTAVTGGDGRGGSGFRREGCTGWTTRDARGTREVYGRRPTIWWLGTTWTKARRRRRSWRAARRGWAARSGAHRGGQPP